MPTEHPITTPPEGGVYRERVEPQPDDVPIISFKPVPMRNVAKLEDRKGGQRVRIDQESIPCPYQPGDVLRHELPCDYPIMLDRREKAAMPSAILAPHEQQAQLNHGGQSLARLKERGGLAPCEALWILLGQSWGAYAASPAANWEQLQREVEARLPRYTVLSVLLPERRDGVWEWVLKVEAGG